MLLLRAPAGTAVLKLAQQLADGVYDRPFIVDDGEQRRLHFDLRYVQSAINLKDPDELVFAYTQAMMAFMLFDTQPRQVVVLDLRRVGLEHLAVAVDHARAALLAPVGDGAVFLASDNPANRHAITAFLAQVALWMSAIGFVIQVWLTSRIQRFLGVHDATDQHGSAAGSTR